MLKISIRNRFSGEFLSIQCSDMDAAKASLAEFAWLRGWSWDYAPCGWGYSISEV